MLTVVIINMSGSMKSVNDKEFLVFLPWWRIELDSNYEVDNIINPGINLRAAVINSNVSVSPRRYYHTYGDIIIHTTTSHANVRV